MDQVIQAIRELQNQLTQFETKVDERFDRLESRMDRLEDRMDKLDFRMDQLEQNQLEIQDNIQVLVKENWEHKKDLHKVKRRIGME
ncbi:hypothetical protein [Falsibacillus pallidus]|uniref:t-SNARE coiled-coil homology domain-containing protein n=1 Tax=Falsibacillus pallidus TaxID=493781 RepID=A0A370GDI2_9BACI|nr:hypothetical protein [Falsibacillus pallidus]RDI40033.1 hypothetical protein DFR59_11357 [Falsibacillus pallidus]